jgi:RND family efflux transporter MFP subunit
MNYLINLQMKRLIVLFLILSLLVSCTNKKAQQPSEAEKRQYTEQQNLIEVIVLQRTTFKKELVNNGKLVALKKSELQFRVGEQLEKLHFRNGDHVNTGQCIAGLNSFSYRQQVVSSEIQLKRVRLEMQNLLIGQGYNTMDSALIPSLIYDMAKIKSGYAEALQSFSTAQFNLNSTKLSAPFTGILANIKQKQFDQVTAGTSFCTLIDNSEFEAEFRIVESEVGYIRLNGEVHLIPFTGQTIYQAYISEINPIIDENGMILVKARAKNTTGALMDGMNVKVVIEKEVPGQLVVPKSAIVLRDNQEVLFKCVNDSIAFWTYVQTTGENTTSFSVIANADKGAELEAGDTIIVSGNLNLAHESHVTIE